MTAINPRTRYSISQWSLTAGLAALLALCGCKSSNSNSGQSNDPLVSGTRIPSQNLPVPDRGIGSNGKSDPLVSPTSKPSDKSGVGYTDDPSRFKGTYIPGPNSMPAALAGNVKDGEELKIDGNENRVPLQQTGAVVPVVPAKPGEQVAVTGLDPLYRELEKYGCKSADRSLTQENGQWVFQATLPRGVNGAKMGFKEPGRTAEEAIRNVLDDIAAQKQ